MADQDGERTHRDSGAACRPAGSRSLGGLDKGDRIVPGGWTPHLAHPHARIFRNRTNVHCKLPVLVDLSQDMGLDSMERKHRRLRRESPLPPMWIRGMEGPGGAARALRYPNTLYSSAIVSNARNRTPEAARQSAPDNNAVRSRTPSFRWYRGLETWYEDSRSVSLWINGINPFSGNRSLLEGMRIAASSGGGESRGQGLTTGNLHSETEYRRKIQINGSAAGEGVS